MALPNAIIEIAELSLRDLYATVTLVDSDLLVGIPWIVSFEPSTAFLLVKVDPCGEMDAVLEHNGTRFVIDYDVGQFLGAVAWCETMYGPGAENLAIGLVEFLRIDPVRPLYDRLTKSPEKKA